MFVVLHLHVLSVPFSLFFFFHATATTEIYTLSLHDALPICGMKMTRSPNGAVASMSRRNPARRHTTVARRRAGLRRSEEHTSELQSLTNLVCRLLLEKKKKKQKTCQTILHRKTTSL